MNISKNYWKVLGASVTGASHERRKTPNQDALLFKGSEDIDTKSVSKEAYYPKIVAVSDGHGSPKYFRSKEGASFAMDAIGKMRFNIEHFSSEALTDGISEEIIRKVKFDIVKKWNALVDEHIKENPFEEDEAFLALPEETRAKLLNPEILDAEDEIATRFGLARPRKAYGCTLLAAFAFPDALLTLQLGDGDILALYKNEVVERVPYETELTGEATESLCNVENSQQIQHKLFRFGEAGSELPILLTLSTDGIAKSYEEESDFLEIPKTLKKVIENNTERKEVIRLLNGFLEKVTEEGSGDDCTLAAVYDKKRFSVGDDAIKTGKIGEEE